MAASVSMRNKNCSTHTTRDIHTQHVINALIGQKSPEIIEHTDPAGIFKCPSENFHSQDCEYFDFSGIPIKDDIHEVYLSIKL